MQSCELVQWSRRPESQPAFVDYGPNHLNHGSPGQESEHRKQLEEENKRRLHKISATWKNEDHSISGGIATTSLREKQNEKEWRMREREPEREKRNREEIWSRSYILLNLSRFILEWIKLSSKVYYQATVTAASTRLKQPTATLMPGTSIYHNHA